MALCRGTVAFKEAFGRSLCCRQPIKRQSWSLNQVLDRRFSGPSRAISKICSALSSSSCLCHGQDSQLALKLLVRQRHALGHEARGFDERDDWEEMFSLSVLPGSGDCEGQHTVVKVPDLRPRQLTELIVFRYGKCGVLFFHLPTVDGRSEDDINVRGGRRVEDLQSKEVVERESFHSLFGTDCCPAPFMRGSQFYCFPGLGAGKDDGRQRERDEKLALMYESLRNELPNFFVKGHNYSLYSKDVEFINGLLNTKTRGLTVYQLTLTLWKLLCRLYMADVQLEVLKLTKHSEDNTVRARWRVRGQPYHLMPLRFSRRDKAFLYRTYDAFSTFYLGPDGLIHCHRVDKVMQLQPPVLPRVTSLLAGALVALGIQEHRPALNLLPFLLSSLRLWRQ